MTKDELTKHIADLAARRRFVNDLYALADGDQDITANVDRISKELTEDVIALLNLTSGRTALLDRLNGIEIGPVHEKQRMARFTHGTKRR